LKEPFTVDDGSNTIILVVKETDSGVEASCEVILIVFASELDEFGADFGSGDGGDGESGLLEADIVEIDSEGHIKIGFNFPISA
jgi:hypothetical protein